jgi:hypothetical protein
LRLLAHLTVMNLEDHSIMKYGVSCKLGLGLGIALLLAGGCATPETGANEGVGTARVRIEASHTDSFELTLVRVTAQGGFQAELVRDNSGAFSGVLQLPAGFNELVGEAFAGNELVGVSAPVPVQIQAGLVTAANIRIIDITGGQDIGHSPIVLSLTHPLSAVTNHPVQLAVTAVDPDGQGVSAEWSSDCADAQLSFPFDAVTDFTKPAPGICRVSVTVSDGELSNTESFNIVVFDETQVQGAVNVDGEFVSAPLLFLDLHLPDGSCNLFSDSQDGTCQSEIAAPTRAFTNVFVDWGNAEPGFLEVTDNCGGAFENLFGDANFLQGDWRPPLFESVCLVTARAFSADGVFSQVSAAVLVRNGQPDPIQSPQIFAELSHGNGNCQIQPGTGEVFCDVPVPAGNQAFMFAQVDWGNLAPGTLTVFDTCGGQYFNVFNDLFFFQANWQAPFFDTPCTIVVQAIATDGNSFASFLNFSVVGAQPPADIQARVLLQQINGDCFLEFGQTAVDCPAISANGNAFFQVEMSWGNALPGFIDVRDNCGGFFSAIFNDPFIFQANWFPPPFIGNFCTIDVNAFAGNGQVRTFQLFVPIG